MCDKNSFSHLTLEERRIILTGIMNGSSKTAIAQTIGKDKSTVGKEIKLHRYLSHKCSLPLECSAYKKCPYGRECSTGCPGFIPFHCSRRDRSPGACNGCAQWNHCRFNKFTYSPEDAQHRYRETLVDSRLGVNLTSSEARHMALTIAPLLKQGLSPYRILQIHPELGISEKTLYNYIEDGVLHEVSGICSLDLRRQASRRPRKKKGGTLKKRADNRFLLGRTYKDYRSYLDEHPGVSVTQMDTVYNDESAGPFIQTFKFLDTGILFGILHREKTALSMKQGVDLLEGILGPGIFRRHVHVLLTDRGTEFSDAEGMENSADMARRTRVFYCDPMMAGQKGSLENKHEELRYILPKGTDLEALGLRDQDSLNLALSHVNSAPVEKLGGKSPLELAAFLYPDLYERLAAFGIRQVDKDKILPKPYLLKRAK